MLTFILRQYSLLFICLSIFGILNYEGLIFDAIGYAVDAINPRNTTHAGQEQDIQIGGEDISSFLNHHLEVPYNWTVGTYTYVIFLSAAFMGTIILEGVNGSIMARVTPPKLNDVFLNSGLLATMIGTIGRVGGDSMITFSAFVDKDIYTDFVNATFFPIIPIAVVCYILVRCYYNKFGDRV